MKTNSASLSRQSTMPSPLRTYEELRRHIEELFIEGKKRAQEALEREKVRTYWQIGKSIDRHVLESGKRADYGKQVIHRLSRDLKTNETLLYYALQFSRSYEELPERENLSWSHYKALLPIKTDEERKVWESRAEEWGWSSRALESAIADSRKKPAEEIAGREAAFAGSYVYRISQKSGKMIWLDLGFSCHMMIESPRADFFPGDLVKSIPDSSPVKYRYVRAQDSSDKDLYHYRAVFHGFREGALWCRVNLGFNFCIDQGFTIAGMDAGKLSGEQGKRLKTRLAKLIRPGESLKLHSLRTAGRKNDRYAGDFWVGGRSLKELLE